MCPVTETLVLKKKHGSTAAWWGHFSVTHLLRLPGLVLCVLSIHQFWILSGQQNQRVALWTGSGTQGGIG